jgi:hypothetical protein
MELYLGHWMDTKAGLENGTGKVIKSRETPWNPPNAANLFIAT